LKSGRTLFEIGRRQGAKLKRGRTLFEIGRRQGAEFRVASKSDSRYTHRNECEKTDSDNVVYFFHEHTFA